MHQWRFSATTDIVTSVSGEPQVVSPLAEGATGDRPPHQRRPVASALSGRHGHELAASQADRELLSLRKRAERAEAALAEHRRDAARAIRALQAEVAYWRLRAAGRPPAEAAGASGLDKALDA